MVCGIQAFFNDIPKDSNQKDIFLVDKIDTNVCDNVDDRVDDCTNDENAKIEELCELSVNTSYGRGVYNAIVLRIF